MKINLFTLHRSPKAFHKDVIVNPTPTIHADPDSSRLKMLGELHTGKLNSLIRIEDIRFGDPEAFSNAPTQKAVSRVVEISQART